jgi:hypothetical protein
MKKKLSNKLSDWIDYAVADMRKLAKKKNFKFDMNDTWLTKEKGQPCVVCMAGSVMACRLKPLRKDLGNSLYPCFYGKYEALLQAVNLVRKGAIIFALDCVGESPCWEQVSKIEDLITTKFNNKLGRAPLAVYTRAAKELRALNC